MGFIPDMYSSNQERLIQGMTIREAKNFCRLRIVDIQNLLYLESGREKRLYDRVSISYWFSGKRKPRREWLFNILERKVTERKDFIDRADLDVYKLLIQRPKIMLDALKYAKVVAYVDADSIATKYAQKMFDFYHDQSYPLFVHGIYDYLMINGRGGAANSNDLSGTLEAPICDLFNINQYTRQNYRQTGYFVCGQKTKAFLREWAWMTEHPEIFKNTAYFVPFNEETVVNALLS
jgi:hypothetical protein